MISGWGAAHPFLPLREAWYPCANSVTFLFNAYLWLKFGHEAVTSLSKHILSTGVLFHGRLYLQSERYHSLSSTWREELHQEAEGNFQSDIQLHGRLCSRTTLQQLTMKVVFHFRRKRGVTFWGKLKTLEYRPFSKYLDFERSQGRDIICQVASIMLAMKKNPFKWISG